jgi:hypothetical protein
LLLFDTAVWLSAGAAAIAGLAAVLVPLTAFLRRPRLALQVDEDGIQSRVEEGTPYIRLLVSNPRWVRAAHGTRVLVEYYRARSPRGEIVTLGHPQLGWTSVPPERHESTVIFAGASRAVDFGTLLRGPLSGLFFDSSQKDPPEPWDLMLPISGLAPADERHILSGEKDGYVVRLLVGDDDGRARRYDVEVAWDARAVSPEAALDSVRMVVHKVR